jgi:hypothetical protein
VLKDAGLPATLAYNIKIYLAKMEGREGDLNTAELL